MWGGAPFLSIDRQEKKKIICGLVALADSCRGKKDNVHHHQEFFTIIKFIVFLICTPIIIIIVFIWRHAQY